MTNAINNPSTRRIIEAHRPRVHEATSKKAKRNSTLGLGGLEEQQLDVKALGALVARAGGKTVGKS